MELSAVACRTKPSNDKALKIQFFHSRQIHVFNSFPLIVTYAVSAKNPISKKTLTYKSINFRTIKFSRRLKVAQKYILLPCLKIHAILFITTEEKCKSFLYKAIITKFLLPKIQFPFGISFSREFPVHFILFPFPQLICVLCVWCLVCQLYLVHPKFSCSYLIFFV